MIEKEMKILLTQEQYNLLNQKIDWGDGFVQKNYYYLDDDGELRENDITVRIREKNNVFKLQTKVPVEEKGALKIKEEKEKNVPQVYSRIDKSLFGDMINVKANELRMIGVLETKRKIICFDNVEVCLDLNMYLGKVDYELEIEYSSEEIPEKIFHMLREYVALDVSEKAKGKNWRFLHWYDVVKEG